MGSIMIDDTRTVDCTVTESQVASSIEDIRQQAISRLLAKRWARSLRFLTFDDEDEFGMGHGISQPNDNPSFDSKTSYSSPSRKEMCARCEYGVRLPQTGHHCASHRGPLRNFPDENFNKADLDACSHVRDLTCSYCQHVPLFPSHGKARRFRIRRVVPERETLPEPEEWDPSERNEFPCGHFVAVSYCWESQFANYDGEEEGVDEAPYTVVEEDGSIRPARAPRSTLDRAVAFAAQNGYRLIWIDQECIQQDDEVEKDIAVNAMDFVYVAAHTTIGLMSTFLQQEHLDNLFYFEEAVGPHLNLVHRGSNADRRTRRNEAVHAKWLEEALVKVVNDRWNTRAWILQEAFAAAGNLFMLFPLSWGVSTENLPLICHEKSFTEICVNFETLHDCLKIASKVPELVGAASTDPEVMEAVTKVETLCPRVYETQSSFQLSVGGTRSRDTCSAATALSFLRHRDNVVVVDRLAIIANLCGYELRLNTNNIQHSQPSLAICVVVLAIMNGDLSLLIPELYHSSTLTQVRDMSHLESLVACVRDMPQINSTLLSPRGAGQRPAAPESYFLTGTALRAPATMWKVDRYLRLRRIQEKYSEPWSRLNKQRDELAALGQAMDHMRRRERAVSQILFDITMELRARGESPAANAIWMSVGNLRWPKFEKDWKLTQTVEQFPRNTTMENRREMFNLVPISSDVAYHPEWLIDRVMKRGGLWLASPETSPREYRLPCPSSRLRHKDGFGTLCDPKDLFDEHYEKHRDEESLTAGNSLDGRSISSTSSPQEDDPADGKTRNQGNALLKQGFTEKDVDAMIKDNFKLSMTGNIVAQLTNIFLLNIEVRPKRPDQSEFGPSRALTEQGALFGGMMDCGLDQVKLMAGKCAIFDIEEAEEAEDAQTTILTPFQMPLEGYQVSSMRHMSISRVVQKVGTEGKYDRFHTKSLVRGMWPIMIYPGGRYNLV